MQSAAAPTTSPIREVPDDELEFVRPRTSPDLGRRQPDLRRAVDQSTSARMGDCRRDRAAIPHVFSQTPAVAILEAWANNPPVHCWPCTRADPRDPGASQRPRLDGMTRYRGWVETHVREDMARGGEQPPRERTATATQTGSTGALWPPSGPTPWPAATTRPRRGSTVHHQAPRPGAEHRPEAAPDRALVFADAEAERRAAIRLAEEQAEKEEAIARHTDDRIRLARQLDEALSEVIESMPAAARADALAHTAAAPRAAPPPPPAPRKALEGETLDRVVFRAIPADIRTEVLAHVAAPPRAAPTPELAKPVIVEDMRARVQRAREVADPPPPPPVTIQDLAAAAAAERERAADARAEAEKRLQAAADQAEAERARARAEERAQADADQAQADADPDADRAQADADQAAADADQAAAERAAAERAEAARRRFQDASAAALEATRGPAADVADAWPRNVEAGDVAEALDRLHATAYQEQIEVDGAELAVGELRMGVELEISDAAEEMRHAARPVPEAERGAAVASIVRAIQDAAVRLVERVLDHVMPGRARRVEDSPPTAATHETATTAKPQPSPEPSPARPTTEHKPEDMPERGAGEDAGGVRRGDQPRDPTTIEH